MSISAKQIISFILLLLLTACISVHTNTPVTPPADENQVDDAVATSTVTSGVGVSGRVVEGYGGHRPVPGLPLRLWDREPLGEPLAVTDANGEFVLTSLPVAQKVYINSGALTFQVIATSSPAVDLGTLKYPLMHPYNYYYWIPYPLQDSTQLILEGASLPFSVCKQDATWQRPTDEAQRARVWSHLPFNDREATWLQAWFRKPALLYDTIDIFTQSFPDGPRLDELGSEQVYLSGLWTATSGPLISSECSYTSEKLTSLLDRSQIEIWLLGYRALEIRSLSTEDADIDKECVCDPQARDCTMRPGYHYGVYVQPARGYQVIRFQGHRSSIAVHIMTETEEIIHLP